MKIGSFDIDEKTLIIAELSANHGQDIAIATETIRAAKRAGADAIKLQTYTPDTMTIECDNIYFKEVLKGSIWEGRTLYDLYNEAYTPWDWHQRLFDVAREEGLICFSTPFDKTSVDFLEQFNPPAYKIASFEIQDIPLIEYTASKGRPMIISTGIAEFEDIDLAVKTCRETGNNNIVLLKCTSSYPAPIEEANLTTIPNMKKKFRVEVGISDHTLGTIAPIVAVSLGARVIEKHFILDKTIGGPDVSFSLSEKEFSEMVTAVRVAEQATGNVTYRLSEKAKQSKKFARSIFVVKNLKKGDVITEDAVKSIRPNFGLHPKYLPDIIGKKVNKTIQKGTPFSLDT
ncbi:pseudaminic acid synthase [Geofilum rubicundum]|uniref:N-acetylneuraminate synthase n=1 Tax=Geofilum rubicundum JCM 15548 TaxID=1236989 RepID=A0A0E9LYR8_9BACT|nr:pseudaminic acid synthase [Geofilum rubicundum]GAO30428.1 N-acetylneuraminate synthase [Geofilum rubicundum JCM 15548]